jgi:hypothetical protein
MNVGFGAGASMGLPQTQHDLAVGLFLCPSAHSLYVGGLLSGSFFFGVIVYCP